LRQARFDTHTYRHIGISAIAGCGGGRLKATTSHTALLYGDSLSWESTVNNAHCPRDSRCHTETVQEFMAAHRNWRLVVRAFPGTAPCDWLKSLPGELGTYKPDVVILQTEGDDATACMDAPGTHSPYPIASAGVYAKYRSDLDTFFAEVTATGAKMIGVPPIMTTDQKFNQQVTAIDRIMIREAAKIPESATTSRPGNAVTDNGRFTFKKQCLASETAAKGCTNGLIPVREPTGLHFCPVGLTFPAGCPVYSSGAYRFGKNILDALISASNNP
jgi:hypothetical protein